MHSKTKKIEQENLQKENKNKHFLINAREFLGACCLIFTGFILLFGLILQYFQNKDYDQKTTIILEKKFISRAQNICNFSFVPALEETNFQKIVDQKDCAHFAKYEPQDNVPIVYKKQDIQAINKEKILTNFKNAKFINTAEFKISHILLYLCLIFAGGFWLFRQINKQN